MRMAFIILGLTAIAIGLVHLRRAEMAVRYDRQRLESRRATLRREIWDRQVELGHLTRPDEVELRARAMALDLMHETPAPAGSRR
jgi:hypothetical protein